MKIPELTLWVGAPALIISASGPFQVTLKQDSIKTPIGINNGTSMVSEGGSPFSNTNQSQLAAVSYDACNVPKVALQAFAWDELHDVIIRPRHVLAVVVDRS